MLQLVDIDKHFGAVHAVRRASFEAQSGRIHAVCGENGAGKSTLLKIAAAVLSPDAGKVLIGGTPLSPHTPVEAIRRGIGMVQQHFALVGVFTALENVVLGVEPVRALGVLDLGAARMKVEKIARELGAEIPLDVPVELLGVGDRQRLEIVRTLYRDAQILILDEPTAVLTPGEAHALYETLRRLAETGRAIIVVTHKLDEVGEHADDVTVMRRGEIIFSRALGADRAKEVVAIAEGIMGGETAADLPRQERERGEAVLTVEGLSLGRALNGVSLAVKAGEVVGIAGVEGNGQRELIHILGGQVDPDKGTVSGGPIAVVHEDRHKEGLVLDATTRDNVLLGELARFSRMGRLDFVAMDTEARGRVKHARAPENLDALVRTLSGGNQQKLVIARAIGRVERGAKVLVLAHPTRGVDLGASRSIHQDVLDAAKRGVGVLVVSADLQELRAICDRILVMARGRIVREMLPSASDAEIGRAMLAVEGSASAIDGA